MEIFNPHSNINFLGWRKVSVTISVILVILSVTLILTRGLHFGLDFTGGVVVEVNYDKPVDSAEVRQALNAAGINEAVVQTAGGTREVSIRLQPRQAEEGGQAGQASKTGKTNLDQVATDVVKALKSQRADVHLKRRDFVGPQVGEELRNSGVIAVIVVIIGIMIYLGVRFEKRFALAALATEVHDTLLTVGFFALTQREFDLTVLASVLAVVGYSINDKVVVFDRVRELFRITRKAQPEETLNRAINSTLSRTIITSLFTGITMLALFIFGGPVVHGFALTMIIGIIIGTLSSIFFASPILLWLGVSKKDLMPVTRDNPELARRP